MSHRILLVENNPVTRGLVREQLESRGMRVAELDQARPALARLQAERFDLLITAVELPQMSGLWLLRHARRHRTDLPVILVTSGIPPGQIPLSFGVADAVLLKPFSLPHLEERVKDLLQAK